MTWLLAATFERMQALSRRSREQLNASIMMIAKSLSAEDRRRYFEAGVKKSRRYLRDKEDGQQGDREAGRHDRQ